MSEASKCDRCGSLREGSPYAHFQVEGGRPRIGPNEEPPREYRGFELASPPIDLCRSCINDLRKWYADGGGDRSDISGNWMNDADDGDSA